MKTLLPLLVAGVFSTLAVFNTAIAKTDGKNDMAEEIALKEEDDLNTQLMLVQATLDAQKFKHTIERQQAEKDFIPKYLFNSDRIEHRDEHGKLFNVLVEINLDNSLTSHQQKLMLTNRTKIHAKSKKNNDGWGLLYSTIEIAGEDHIAYASFDIIQSDVEVRANADRESDCKIEIAQHFTYNTPHFFKLGECNFTITLHTNHSLLYGNERQILNK